MHSARQDHTATLLTTGRVLVVGGSGITNLLSSVESYDQDSGSWTNTGTLSIPRRDHTATLLPDGKVLVAGGSSLATNLYWFDLTSAELYEPTLGTWKVTGSLNTRREWHRATLLSTGKVLVAGGYTFDSTNLTDIYLSSAELYDPATGAWTETGAMTAARKFHTLTLLPDGKVLVTGGFDGSRYLSSAEVYDPASETWKAVGPMSVGRVAHTAILLPNGKVLIAGGTGSINPGYLSSAELFDPATRTWTVVGALNTGRTDQTATLLANGRVVIAGGGSTNRILPSVELYDVGLGFLDSWRPEVAALTSPLKLGGCLALSGFGFRGVSGGSGGTTQESPCDYPLVQLRGMESGQTIFLPSTNWSASSFTSLPVWSFPAGYVLATVFVNGVPSTSAVVKVSVPVPTAATLTGMKALPDGAFQFSFTNSPGAVFGVLTSTNLSVPSSNWSVLGGVLETSPGQFQFTDPQATNSQERFYRIRSS